MSTMTVQSVMKSDVATLSLSDTFSKALDLMLDQGIRSIPIVDNDGIYRGMVDFYDVWEVLLPKAAMLEESYLHSLAFLATGKETLQEMLCDAGQLAVCKFLNGRDAPAVHPHTPMQEAIRLLNELGGNLPVVDKDTGRLVGIVAPGEGLQAIRSGEAAATSAKTMG